MSSAEVLCPSCGERVPSHFGNCWKCQSELKGAAPAPGSSPSRRCNYCDGTDLELGVTVGAGDPHAGTFGKVPTTVGLLFAGGSLFKDLQGGSLEVLRADLCKECGTIVRMYVDEVDRVWLKHD